MVWTAIINEVVDVRKEKGYLIVRAILTDGNQKVQPDEYHIHSQTELNANLLRDIANLEQSDSDIVKIPLGTYDPNPPPPSPFDDARNLYAFNLELLQRYKRAIGDEAITETNQDYLNAKDFVSKNFLPEFIDLF